MLADRKLQGLKAALDRLSEILPYIYAQWVVHCPPTWDYRVVVSRSPSSAGCYDIAHRPGVIGQVFRREFPIFIPDARTHPLYDAYDSQVEWELAIPLLDGDTLAGVLNFEGGGRFELDGALWSHLERVISAKAELRAPLSPPTSGEAWMVATTRVAIPRSTTPIANDALRLGRAAANGGLSVLVTGPLDLPSSSNYPTVHEAVATGLPIGSCFRGGGYRFDLLDIGRLEENGSAESIWWSTANGRYDFVLVII